MSCQQWDNIINRRIGGKTKLYGLIGDPVEHTISPQIHNTLADFMNIDMVYLPLHTDKEHLETAIKGLKALEFSGFNVTIPFKEKVIEYLDEVDATAKAYDAVNTVVVEDGRLIGYNTDADGFYRAFTETFACQATGLKVLIIGAGGAASSIAFNMVVRGAASVTVANRTIENADKIAQRINNTYENKIKTDILNDNMDISPFDVIINTTSVGMHPKVENTVLKNSIFRKEQKVVDIIYNPTETIFLKRAREYGASTLNGFGMLFYQAVIAFELWNAVKVHDKDIRQIYNNFSTNLGKII